jgi:plasmid stabilization system protein ParE
VAQVVYAARALDNLERLIRFPVEDGSEAAFATAVAIRSAVETLAAHPLIGRPGRQGLYELVISLGKTGYVALYRHVPVRDEVRILGLRHQHELDYPL